MRQLAILLAVLAAAALLLWWVDPRQLYLPLCAFHELTGMHCPGCGAVRATHELLHGRVLSALRYNALWVVLLPLLAYAGLSEAARVVRGRALPGDPLRKPRVLAAVLAAAVLFGVLRNIGTPTLAWLAPP